MVRAVSSQRGPSLFRLLAVAAVTLTTAVPVAAEANPLDRLRTASKTSSTIINGLEEFRNAVAQARDNVPNGKGTNQGPAARDVQEAEENRPLPHQEVIRLEVLREAALSARARAETATSKLTGPIAQGADRVRQAEGLLGSGQWLKAKALYEEAIQTFRSASTDTAEEELKSTPRKDSPSRDLARDAWWRAIAARSRAIDRGARSAPEFAEANRLLLKGDEALEAGRPSAAIDAYTNAREILDGLSSPKVAVGPGRDEPVGPSRSAKIGSDAKQLEFALNLCRSFGDQCRAEWYESEEARAVTLEPFEIDSREVTVEEYSHFVAATGYVTTAERVGFAQGWNGLFSYRVVGANWRKPADRSGDFRQFANHPVVHVSYIDARSYCEWRGARLPTEEEWEVAARGFDSRIFPLGLCVG